MRDPRRLTEPCSARVLMTAAKEDTTGPKKAPKAITEMKITDGCIREFDDAFEKPSTMKRRPCCLITLSVSWYAATWSSIKDHIHAIITP